MIKRNFGYTYPYYSGTFDAEKYRRSMIGARDLAEYRLNPSLNETDSLIYWHRRPIVEKWCAQLTKTDLVILDVGGRIQPYRAFLEKKCRSYIAVDLMMEGLVNVLATGERLPFHDSSFDLVIGIEVIQYIPDISLAVEEMYRVLRPGGKMMLSARGSYPECHDEYWRFIPSGLEHLTRMFSTVEIEPEGGSGSGIAVSINAVLHRDIKTPWIARIAKRTTIPIVNRVGLLADRLMKDDSRNTCSYSLLAVK
jgi:SAM-dependent methyltransferase